MGLLNYTTKIDPDKTAAEIAKCLSSHGAQAVMTEYDKDEGFVSALAFQIIIGDQKVAFRLPCDYRPVLEVMYGNKRMRHTRHAQSERKLQAIRTAWRIVKDWVEAQMALVETQMTTTQQVFLPYAIMRDGRTLAEHVQTNPAMLLGESKNV